MNKRYQQLGMTLVEIMIALLIGAFLLGGVMQIFVNSKQTYRMQEGLSRLQENGRFALDFLTKEIRMAGFVGCSNATSVNNIIDPKNPNPNPTPSTLLLGTHAVLGNDNVTNNWSTNACGASNACVAGSDSITFFSGGSCGGSLIGNMTSDNANIQISNTNTCDLNQYDVFIIADCSSTDIVIASSVSSGASIETVAHANNQNSDNKLSKAYGPDAEVLKFNSYIYFLRLGASGQPALWRLENSKASGPTNPIELIEGIENMQILYGIDTDDDDDADATTSAPDGPPNYYVSANNIAASDWFRVVSVRISLLAASIDDNLTSQPVPYTYNGVTVTPLDRKIRRIFDTTIAVRNRLR